MAFKEVIQTPENPTFGFGGINKKTNKPDPKQYEGYYLTSRTVKSELYPDVPFVLHTLRTQKGDIDLWSKADLTRKMKSVAPGTKVRITLTDKTKKVGMGTMKVFLVEQDDSDVIEVPAEYAGGTTQDNSGEGNDTDTLSCSADTQEDDTDLDEETQALDEATPARPVTQQVRRPADPARAAKVQALLRGSKAAG